MGVLDPGQECTAQADVRIPIGLSGAYHVFVQTDDDNRMFEYVFENNNITESTLPVAVTLTPYADLETSGITVPSEIQGSDPITITWTVVNRGTGTTGDGTPGGTVAQWTDRVVFSRNAVFGDADDRLVADIPHSGTLQSGESYIGTWTGEVPGSLSGEYYVFVAADWGNEVYEHDDLYPNAAHAADKTYVRQWVIQPGTLTEDTVWDGLIEVLGTVTVPAGRTLTIMPGADREVCLRHPGDLWPAPSVGRTGRLHHPYILER